MGEYDDEVTAETVEEAAEVEGEGEPLEPPAEEPPADAEGVTLEPPAEEPPAEEPPAEEPPAEEPPAHSEGEPDVDELDAAIVASTEQVQVEATLDDITPGTTQPVSEDEAVDASTPYGAPWWPYLIYLAVWFVFAGIAVWQFEQLPQGTAVYQAEQYVMFIIGGIVLSVAGILLIVAVWLGTRLKATRQRVGLFSSAFIKGAITILIGVVLWWGTILVLDYMRLGRLI